MVWENSTEEMLKDLVSSELSSVKILTLFFLQKYLSMIKKVRNLRKKITTANRIYKEGWARKKEILSGWLKFIYHFEKTHW